MSQFLSGNSATHYPGVNARRPPETWHNKRDPNQYDTIGYTVLDLWQNDITLDVWILISLQGDENSKGEKALWIKLTGTTDDLISLTGDTGDNPVFGDANQNINIVGAEGINTIGDAPNNTVFIGIDGTVANIYDTDFETPAIPFNNLLQVKGGITLDAEQVPLIFRKNIHTAANPTNSNLLEVKLNDSISIPNTTANGRAGIIYQGGVATTVPSNTFIHSYGSNNTFVGSSAGNLTLTVVSAVNNTMIGWHSGMALTTGQQNSCLGTNAGPAITTGVNNDLIGTGCGMALTTGTNNNIMGSLAFGLATSANHNSGVGDRIFNKLLTGTDNCGMGLLVGDNYASTESYNIVIGSTQVGLAGETGIVRIGSYAGTTNTANTFIGFSSGNSTYTLASAVNNTFVGATAGDGLTTGNSNCAFGVGSMTAAALSGSNNSCFGFGAGGSITSGAENVFIGSTTGSALTTGIECTAVGQGAFQLGTGSDNTCLGARALEDVTSGTENLALGVDAGSTYTSTESNNVLLAHNGVLGESNHMRLGTTGNGAGQVNKTWIAAVRGVTTDVADAIPVLIDSTGQLGTTSSSIKYKENVNDMGSLSDDIYKLRPVVFNYKKYSPAFKSVGLIAEEVAQVMPNMVVFDENQEIYTVRYNDLVPMLLNEIQKLNKRITLLEAA